MTRFEAWTVHLSSLLVGGTGLVYAWMRYFAEPVDPYAVVNHPWQPTLQHLHILVAPLMVFAVGFIWREHVWKHWGQKVRGRRRTGLSLMLTVVPMVVSGYLIQTAVSDTWRGVWVAVHLVTSGLWGLAYAGHLVMPWLAKRRKRRSARAAFPVLLLLLFVACAGGGEAPPPDDGASLQAADRPAAVTVYCGRDEALIGPLLERFTADTGIEVQVRYGDTGELAANLLEEGETTPADLFISRDAIALGALAADGLFRPLPEELTALVPEHFADPDRLWVGLSARARTVVYDPRRVAEADLPGSLDAITGAEHRGRFGVAPLSGSFQSHMALYRALNGAEALGDLLAGLAANEPKTYPGNDAVVEAVLAGEVDWGLVDHDALWRALAQAPEEPGDGPPPVANAHMAAGDASGFVNVGGVGVLSADPAAPELVRWLLGDEAQGHLARKSYEYPLAKGVEPAVDLVPLAELNTPQIDFREVAAVLEETLQAIRDSGLAPSR